MAGVILTPGRNPHQPGGRPRRLLVVMLVVILFGVVLVGVVMLMFISVPVIAVMMLVLVHVTVVTVMMLVLVPVPVVAVVVLVLVAVAIVAVMVRVLVAVRGGLFLLGVMVGHGRGADGECQRGADGQRVDRCASFHIVRPSVPVIGVIIPRLRSESARRSRRFRTAGQA